MGYILPVENYNYQAYQERIKMERRNTKAVNKPFKAVLDRRHEEVKSQHERTNKRTILRPKRAYLDEEQIANITGKGQRFRQTT